MRNRWTLFCGAALFTACGGDNGRGPSVEPGNSLVSASRESRQCESDGITPAESAQRLINAGIDVLESSCGIRTGVAYAAVCGGDTGDILIHKIRTVNVVDAEALGFLEVSELVDEAQGIGFEIVDCDERQPVPTP